MLSGRNFPVRKQCREIPNDLSFEIIKQVSTTISGYYNINSIRDYIGIYSSNFGIILPYKDIPTYPDDNFTILIYLNDDFIGGNLFIKTPRTNEHTIEYGEPLKKYLNTTIEPRKCYGIIFQKNNTHYTNELLGPNKIIFLMHI